MNVNAQTDFSQTFLSNTNFTVKLLNNSENKQQQQRQHQKHSEQQQISHRKLIKLLISLLFYVCLIQKSPRIKMDFERHITLAKACRADLIYNFS